MRNMDDIPCTDEIQSDTENLSMMDEDVAVNELATRMDQAMEPINDVESDINSSFVADQDEQGMMMSFPCHAAIMCHLSADNTAINGDDPNNADVCFQPEDNTISADVHADCQAIDVDGVPFPTLPFDPFGCLFQTEDNKSSCDVLIDHNIAIATERVDVDTAIDVDGVPFPTLPFDPFGCFIQTGDNKSSDDILIDHNIAIATECVDVDQAIEVENDGMDIPTFAWIRSDFSFDQIVAMMRSIWQSLMASKMCKMVYTKYTI